MIGSMPPRNQRREPAPDAAGAESPLPPAASRSVRPGARARAKAPESKQAPKPRADGPRFPLLSKAFGAAKLLVGIAVVVGASGGVAWGTKRYVTTSPRFAVRTVAVEGVSRLSAAEVARHAGLAVGDNVFSIELDEVRHKLEAHPWIASARVSRKLPGAVIVSVVEHEPKALVSVADALYLVDAKGAVFKQVDADDAFDLPLVTGVAADKIVSDREGVEAKLRDALELVDDVTRSELAKRHPLQEVHLEKDGTVLVVVGSEAIALHLGRPPYKGKLEQASRVLDEIGKRKAQASMIFLDNDASPERVVVRMR
jgi:cell division protein FtsQ